MRTTTTTITCDICGAVIDEEPTSMRMPILVDKEASEWGLRDVRPYIIDRDLELCDSCLGRALVLRIIPQWIGDDTIVWRDDQSHERTEDNCCTRSTSRRSV